MTLTNTLAFLLAAVSGVSPYLFSKRGKIRRPLFKSLGKGFLTALVTCGVAVSAVAQTAELPTGAGTAGDPYQIATLDHLCWVSSNAPAFSVYTYFVQTADIDASATTNWYGGTGWQPISCNKIAVYDGQGHTISGLVLNDHDLNDGQPPYFNALGYVGFLGDVVGGEFKNLGLVNVNIGAAIGAQFVGGFAGRCKGTVIRNCFVTGTVEVVEGANNRSGAWIGGLIGRAFEGSLIERCSFNGTVTWPEFELTLNGAGGLIGYGEDSAIRKSYSMGVVGIHANSEAPLGGLVGKFEKGTWGKTDATITESYSVALVWIWSSLNSPDCGAFIGTRGSSVVTNCYFDNEVSYYLTATGGTAGGYPVGITGANTAAMKTQATYKDWLFSGLGADWGLSADKNEGYPYLKEPSTAAAPTVTTAAITSIGSTAANGGGDITALGGEDVTQHGLCWSTLPAPTTAGSKTTLGAASATGAFTSSISGLSYGTKYYVRAYAENSAGPGYGEEVSFTTLSRADAVAAAKAALEIGYAAGDSASNVTQNVTLPLNGASDCSVTWASGSPTVILVEGGGGPASVFRPLSSDGDATVTLTATITSGASSDTKVFTVTVKAEAITLSADMVEQVMPDKLHVASNKRLTLIGRNFRAYVNKAALSFSVSKGGWSGPIAADDIRVASDQLMTITVPVDPAVPLGAYTLHLDHNTLPDLALADAYEVTDDPADQAQTIQELVMKSTNPDVDVQTLSIKGAFDEELPGCYTIAGEGQTVLFNSYLKLEVEGDDLTVDLRAGRKRITGTGRFTVDAEDASGNVSSATLYEGAFELTEYDMEFVFSGAPTLTDYLGIGMEVGPKSMVFTQDGEDYGLSMQGLMNAGFNFLGRVGAEANVDEVQVRLDGFDLVANMGVEANFEIAGFDSPRLALGLDTRTPEYSVGCGATIPKLSEKYGFDLDFTIRKGKLQSIAFLIRYEILMPTLGAKITAFGGGVENLADQSQAPFTVRARGQVSDMVTPEVMGNNFLNTDMTLGVSAYHMEANGTADIYGLLDIGSASLVVVWDASGHPRYTSRGFQLEGHVDILDAILGDLTANYWENQGFFGEYEAKVQIPDYVPLVGGTKLKEERFYSDQYLATAPVKICGIPTIVTYKYDDSSIAFDVKGFPLVQQIGKALINFGSTIYDIGKQVGEVMNRSLSAAKDALMRGDLGEAATELANGLVESARVAAEQTALAVAEMAVAVAEAIAEQAQAIADAVAEAAEEVADALEDVGDAICDFFCEEGRNALSKNVSSEMTALIEVRGMVSNDLVIQAPDYYTTFLTNKPAATRFFRADSGYPIAHPNSKSTVTLVDYNPATGEGNMLYRPETKKAYAVVNLNQVGYWNFIDWNWINAYPDPAVRSNVLNYASMKIYKLTPGCTLDYVVKNLLVTNAPGSVLDLTEAVAKSGASRFLLSIASDSEKVSLYRPAGGAYRLQLDRNQPDWNALYVKEVGKFYAVLEPGAELAGWHIKAAGHASARAIGITNSTLSMMESLARSGLSTGFRLTDAHVASGKAMIALGHATEACALYRPDRSQLPLVFSGPGRNADYQANYKTVYVLAEVTGSSTGLWHAVDGAVVTPSVLALDGASTLESMLALISAAPDVALNKVTLDDVGPWLLRATGVSSTNGITVRDPTGHIAHPAMLATNDAGSRVLYVRVDTTKDTLGEWVFSSSNTLPLKVNWIAEPLLTLPELATRYRAGSPYSFALGLTTIGRRVFEVPLVVPAARRAGFDFASIRNDIVVYRPDGTTVPLEFNEASTNWNAYYHAATTNLYLMADVLNVGWWHVNVPYGRTCTTWLVTGDPAQTMSDFKDVAAGAATGISYPVLAKQGYYLLEMQNGDAGTVIRKPTSKAMVYTEVVQTADNARQVGDTRYVLVESDGSPREWKITSDKVLTLSAAYCYQNVPGPLTLADALDSAVTTELELPADTSWAVNIRSLGSLAAAQSVTLQQPDGTNYVVGFLPPEGLSHVEDYPAANARYETNRTDMVLSINAKQGGTWRLTTPSRKAFDMYQLGFLPSVESFEFAPATGAGENAYDITWKIAHPAAGSVVSFVLASEADILVNKHLGKELAAGLNSFGKARVQVPAGLLPGRYYFVIAVRAASTGQIMEAAKEPISVRYAQTPPAPSNLRLGSVGNGEIVALFDDYNYFGVNHYVIMTHQVRSNQVASSIGVMRFSGAAMPQAPGEGAGNGVGQRVTMAGLLPGQTNLIAVCAVVGEGAASQFSPPSGILEVYLPEPNRPDLGLSVTVPGGRQASNGFYTNYFLYREAVTNAHGRPVVLPGTNGYQTVVRTNAVVEGSTIINATSATLRVTVENGQDCTFEAFLDEVSVGSVATPATQADFALAGLSAGCHSLEVVAVNGAGDRRRVGQRLLVDLTAPYLELFSPLSGLVLYNNAVTLVGQTDRGARLLINSNDVTSAIAANGSFTNALTGLATNKLHTIVLQAIDAAGNVATRKVSVFVASVNTSLYPAGNADMVGIGVANGALRQEFKSKTTNGYTIAASSRSIHLSPTAFSPGATVLVSVNGGGFESVNLQDGYDIHLGAGANSIIVRVLSQDGTTQRDYYFTADGSVPEYTVTPSVAGAGGMALPSDPQTVESNRTAAIEVFPARGFLRRESVGGTAPSGSWNKNIWTTGPIMGDASVIFGFDGGGVMALETQEVSFAATYRDVTNPPSKTVSMSNTGIGTFHWTNQVAYSKGAEGWLSMLPGGGALPVGNTVEFTVAANVAGLNAGSYTATVTVAAADATNAPQRVQIGLTVNKASQTIDFPNPGKQIITNVTPIVATASPSGLPVAFPLVSGPVQLSSFLSPATATYTGGGQVTLVAGQGGNSNWYAAASITQSFWVSSVVWVSDPAVRGSYSNELRYGLYAYEVVSAKPVSYGTTDLPPWLTLTNLDLIETLAGNGEIGFGGPATNAAIGLAGGVKVGANGSFYFTDEENHRVCRVDTNGLMQTVAGNGLDGYSGDGGAATEASLVWPMGVDLDERGNLYIADFGAHVVRRVDTNGTISTVAGTGEPGFGGDGGPATDAKLYAPSDVCAHGGLLYIVDEFNSRVRVVNASGSIHTVAGNGEAGYSGDGGAATDAALLYPTAVAVAFDGRVLIADRYNNRIRAVSTNGVITTLAGTGEYGFGGDGGAATEALLNYPRGVAVDDLGRVFIADTENARLRLVETNGIIRTISGTGNYGYSGDGGPAREAMLDAPAGIDLDPTRGIVFADVNNLRIRRVRLSAGLLSGVPQETGLFPMTLWASDNVTSNDQSFAMTIDKAHASVALGSLDHTYDGTEKIPSCDTLPAGLTVRLTYNGVTNAPINAGIYVVTGLVSELNWEGFSTATLTIRKAAQTINFVALNDQALPNRVGLAATATPSSYAATFVVASGYAEIAGGTNLSFQRVGPVRIVVSQAGDANYLAAPTVTNTFKVYSPPVWCAEPVTNGSCSGPYRYRLLARDPDSWTVDFGGVFTNLFTLETNLDERVVHAVAGTGIGTYNGDGAFATNHTVYRPSNVSLGSNGCLYVADQYNHRVRRVTRDGYFEAVAGTGLPGFSGDNGLAVNAQLRFPADSVLDAQGNLFIADRDNHRIRKVDQNGTIRTVAGTGLPGFSGDNGPAATAALNSPSGLALDGAGSCLYIADRDNHRIRRMDLSSMRIATVAGAGLPGDAGDGGAAIAARLRNPSDIVLDGAGNLYIADQNNHKVRLVDTNGVMTCLAGTGVSGYAGDGGPATSAMLNKPYGVALDGDGRLYISDTDNHRIRQVELSSGVIRTLAGTGVAGYSGDEIAATNAQFNAPYGMTSDPRGHLFIADNNNHRIRRLDNGTVYLASSSMEGGVYTVALSATDSDQYVTWQTFTVEVTRATQTISFPEIGAQVTTNTVGLAATADSGLGVTFSVLSGSAILTGSNLTFTGAGSVSIVASQPGDTRWLAANEVTNTFSVTQVRQVALLFTPSTPQTYNTTNTLSASGGSGTGAVSFAVLSGVGELVSSNLLRAVSGTGQIVLQAEKADDGMYLVQSAVATVTVARAAQAINFPVIGPKYANSNVGLAATADSGLEVAFNLLSGAANLAGTNLTFSGAGSVTVVAAQAGDDNWNPAASVTNNISVMALFNGAAFAEGRVEVSENAGAVTLTVNGGILSGATSVKVYIQPGTATAADYTVPPAAQLTLAWAAGEVGPKTVTIPVKVDALVEDAETFTVMLGSPAGCVIGEPNFCTVTILDANSGLTLADALDNTLLTWTTGGASVWVPQSAVTSDGEDAAASGAMASNKVSYVQTTASGAGTLSFAWSVAGRGVLRLYDGTKVLAAVTNDTAWETRTFALTPSGTHTLNWAFTQGGGADGRAYLDRVVWLPGGKAGVAVTAAANVPAGGAVSGTGVYYAGAKVPLVAKPRPGWLFTGWTPANLFTSPLTASQTLTLGSSAVHVTANFVKVPVVTGLPLPPEGGAVTGSGICLPGNCVVLNATAAANWWFMGWSDGVQTASRTVTAAVDVTLFAQFKLISQIAPVIVDPGAQLAMVGVPFTLALDITSYSLSTVTVTGLPTGLSYSASTKTIAGVPTASATNKVVTVMAKYVNKTVATATFTMTVEPLPTWAQGNFNGWFGGGAGEGPISGDVTAQGKVSGKLSSRGTNYIFSTASYARRDRDGAFWVTTTASVAKVSMPLTLAVRNPSRVLPPNLSVADGWLAVTADGDPAAMLWRNVWKDAGMASVATNYTGYYTARLPGDSGFGSGYLLFTVDKLGGVKTTGKFADGTAVSLSGVLILDEAGRVFSVLYTAPAAYKGGGFFGVAEFFKTDVGAKVIVRLLDGEPFVWESLSPAATQVYGAGFSRDLGLSGGWYDTLGNLYGYYSNRVMTVGTEGVPVPVILVGTNRYDSTWWDPDGLALTVVTNRLGVLIALTAPRADLPVKVGSSNVYDYASETNTVGLTIALTPATGVFTGSFKAWFDYVTTHTSTTIAYEGVLTPVREDMGDGMAGRGFFLWADTGQYLSPLGKPVPYSFSWSYDLKILLSEPAP